MGQLIDDILALSRLGRREMKTAGINMQELVQGVIGELKAAAPGRDLQFTVAPLPPAEGDPALVRQVWVNLLGNALKFTRPRPVARIAVGAREDKGETVYYIQDNGVGFNMKYQDKLFGVFQRLHTVEEFEGTGVGLAIVQRIVRRHGGRAWGEGELDQGATFFFTLAKEG